MDWTLLPATCNAWIKYLFDGLYWDENGLEVSPSAALGCFDGCCMTRGGTGQEASIASPLHSTKSR